MDDVEEKRGYCKLKEEAVDGTVWRTGCGTVARQNATGMNIMCMGPCIVNQCQ